MSKFKSGASRKITISFISLIVFASCAFTPYPAHGRSDAASTVFPHTLQTSSVQTEGTAIVYGAKIHYVEAGSGPVVVLLHGLGGNAMNWAFNIAPLAHKYRVVVPDQIGFGQSDKPLINYRIATYVDFLDAFLKELKIERASLVGNSMGGWVAASFALAHPEKVEKLVLVDAAGFAFAQGFDTSQLIKLNPSTREGMKELVSHVFYNKLIFMSDGFINASLAARINAGDGHTIRSITESIIRREDILDKRLSAIKQPTLIIWGREDGLLPLADGQRFQKEIAGAQLLVFDQCGHVPQVEKALEFNAAVLRFLASTTQPK
jgi:pimeloyl-ACP methyl ester carboxylesterase